MTVSDHHRIVISRCNSRTELFAVGRLKILFGCHKDIGTGIELQEVGTPLFGQMVRHNKERFLAKSKTFAFHCRCDHFKGFARTHTMSKQGITAVQHMSNGIFLMGTERDRRIHALERDMASVILTGTAAIEPCVVFRNKLGSALRITEDPTRKFRFDGILLLLCKHGFFLVQNPLFFPVLNHLIKDTGITEIQRIFKQLVAVYTVCSVGHTDTDVSVAVTAFAADVPFSR